MASMHAFVEILSPFFKGVACCAGFLLYCITAMGVILYLIFSVAPKHGNSNIFVYLAICSLIGSLSVMSVKASLLDFRLPKHLK